MFGATTHFKNRVMPAVMLLVACSALLGHEWIELSSADKDCHEATCVVCSGHNEDESAAADANEPPQVEFTLAAAKQFSIPASRLASTYANEPIRAPPIT